VRRWSRFRSLIPWVVFLLGLFLYIDAVRNYIRFANMYGLLIALIFFVLWVTMGSIPLTDEKQRSRSDLLLICVFVGLLLNWIASYGAHPSKNYPLILVERGEGTIQVLFSKDQPVFAWGKKIIPIPKHLKVEKPITFMGKGGVELEWKVAALLELEDVSNLQRKVEFLEKYGTLLLPNPKENVEKEFERMIDDFFTDHYGQLLKMGDRKEINIPPSEFLGYKILGYQIRKLTIFPPRILLEKSQ
jgi:hypothetical protein